LQRNTSQTDNQNENQNSILANSSRDLMSSTTLYTEQTAIFHRKKINFTSELTMKMTAGAGVKRFT
jgi:hypothetical protein